MSSLLSSLVGLPVAVGLMALVWKANARRWRRLARVYSSPIPRDSVPRRRQQSLILVGGGVAFNSYKGVVDVGITREGVALSLLTPLSIFHPPLLIPFADLRVRQTSWYLNASSYKYSFDRVHDVEVIVSDDLMEWIASQEANAAGEAAVQTDDMIVGL